MIRYSKHRHSQVGQHIAIARQRRNWSQADLAARSGVARSKISRWEQGHVAPSLWNAWKLADALGIRMDVLIGRMAR